MNDPFNFLLIVVDSCRWDSFQVATTNNVDKYFQVVSAGAMGTFTYPAHMSMFQGFFPTTADARPIYNRFEKSVYRWFYKSTRPNLSEIHGTGSIPKVLRDDHGHRTVSVGGVGWFNKRTPMRLGFEHSIYKPVAAEAVNTFIGLLDKEPYYGLLNFGATHRPYTYPDMPPSLARIRSPRSGINYKSGFSHKLRDKQADCMTHVDELLANLFEWVKLSELRTIACFCADHGDCMGEDNCYGHGFWHPSVMMVPIGWTVFMPGGESYPITEENLKICGFE